MTAAATAAAGAGAAVAVAVDSPQYCTWTLHTAPSSSVDALDDVLYVCVISHSPQPLTIASMLRQSLTGTADDRSIFSEVFDAHTCTFKDHGNSSSGSDVSVSEAELQYYDLLRCASHSLSDESKGRGRGDGRSDSDSDNTAAATAASASASACLGSANALIDRIIIDSSTRLLNAHNAFNIQTNNAEVRAAANLPIVGAIELYCECSSSSNSSSNCSGSSASRCDVSDVRRFDWQWRTLLKSEHAEGVDRSVYTDGRIDSSHTRLFILRSGLQRVVEKDHAIIVALSATNRRRVEAAIGKLLAGEQMHTNGSAHVSTGSSSSSSSSNASASASASATTAAHSGLQRFHTMRGYRQCDIRCVDVQSKKHKFQSLEEEEERWQELVQREVKEAQQEAEKKRAAAEEAEKSKNSKKRNQDADADSFAYTPSRYGFFGAPSAIRMFSRPATSTSASVFTSTFTAAQHTHNNNSDRTYRLHVAEEANQDMSYGRVYYVQWAHEYSEQKIVIHPSQRIVMIQLQQCRAGLLSERHRKEAEEEYSGRGANDRADGSSNSAIAAATTTATLTDDTTIDVFHDLLQTGYDDRAYVCAALGVDANVPFIPDYTSLTQQRRVLFVQVTNGWLYSMTMCKGQAYLQPLTDTDNATHTYVMPPTLRRPVCKRNADGSVEVVAEEKKWKRRLSESEQQQLNNDDLHAYYRQEDACEARRRAVDRHLTLTSQQQWRPTKEDNAGYSNFGASLPTCTDQMYGRFIGTTTQDGTIAQALREAATPLLPPLLQIVCEYAAASADEGTHMPYRLYINPHSLKPGLRRKEKEKESVRNAYDFNFFAQWWPLDEQQKRRLEEERRARKKARNEGANAPSSSTGFAFGASPAATAAAAPTAFGFGAPASASASASAFTPSSGFSFGAPAAAASAPLAFGAPVAAASAQAVAFGFGAPAAAPMQSRAFSFGRPSALPTQSTALAFGAPAASASASAAPSSRFSFGAPAAAAKVKKSGFGFGGQPVDEDDSDDDANAAAAQSQPAPMTLLQLAQANGLITYQPHSLYFGLPVHLPTLLSLPDSMTTIDVRRQSLVLIPSAYDIEKGKWSSTDLAPQQDDTLHILTHTLKLLTAAQAKAIVNGSSDSDSDSSAIASVNLKSLTGDAERDAHKYYLFISCTTPVDFIVDHNVHTHYLIAEKYNPPALRQQWEQEQQSCRQQRYMQRMLTHAERRVHKWHVSTRLFSVLWTPPPSSEQPVEKSVWRAAVTANLSAAGMAALTAPPPTYLIVAHPHPRAAMEADYHERRDVTMYLQPEGTTGVVTAAVYVPARVVWDAAGADPYEWSEAQKKHIATLTHVQTLMQGRLGGKIESWRAFERKHDGDSDDDVCMHMDDSDSSIHPTQVTAPTTTTAATVTSTDDHSPSPTDWLLCAVWVSLPLFKRAFVSFSPDFSSVVDRDMHAFLRQWEIRNDVDGADAWPKHMYDTHVPLPTPRPTSYYFTADPLLHTPRTMDQRCFCGGTYGISTQNYFFTAPQLERLTQQQVEKLSCWRIGDDGIPQSPPFDEREKSAIREFLQSTIAERAAALACWQQRASVKKEWTVLLNGTSGSSSSSNSSSGSDSSINVRFTLQIDTAAVGLNADGSSAVSTVEQTRGWQRRLLDCITPPLSHFDSSHPRAWLAHNGAAEVVAALYIDRAAFDSGGVSAEVVEARERVQSKRAQLLLPAWSTSSDSSAPMSLSSPSQVLVAVWVWCVFDSSYHFLTLSPTLVGEWYAVQAEGSTSDVADIDMNAAFRRQYTTGSAAPPAATSSARFPIACALTQQLHPYALLHTVFESEHKRRTARHDDLYCVALE